ncbi:MAG: ATP-grasp domain-containing protein [Syntrophobacteraceae bacterium]|nr:ATP-grasp domain-containing protein [Syntrophobacteraceae bacterium]
MKQSGIIEFRMALGRRARASRSVAPVGVRPNWEDYPGEVREAFRRATRVYYPSVLYEEICRTLGKETFPRSYYRFMGNKILQTQLFQLLEIPHPRTRIFHGRDRLERIKESFAYPFVAKTPIGSSQGRGVFLIGSDRELRQYLDRHRPAYVQEYFPIDRDLRVVVIGGRVVHAYWRVRRPGDFRNNVAQGASIRFDDIPNEGLDFAVEVARRCSFDEVGMDICRHDNRYFILEANMVYGLEGFRQAGLDLHAILGEMLDDGLI